MKKIDAQSLLKKLTPRNENSSKYSFGHVVIIGGNIGMAGAARMCAEACLRSGAGLVSVYTKKENVSIMLANHPEIMARGIDSINEVRPIIERASIIVIGPGLGRDAWAKNLLDEVLKLDIPKLMDADALWFVAKEQLKNLTNTIFTPHQAEAGRILDCTPEEIDANRNESATKLLAYADHVVLKGHGTIIANKNETYLNEIGNPILAMAGSGDILAGCIAAMFAQGLDYTEASCLGVWLHSHAGDLLAKRREGIRGAVATDLLPFLGARVPMEISIP